MGIFSSRFLAETKNKGSGTGNNGNNSSVIRRPGSGGHKSEAGRPGSGSDGNGSKANLKKVSDTGSGGQAGDKNGTSTDQKKTGSKGKEKDTGKSEDKKKQMRKIMKHLENLPGKRQKQQMVPLHPIPVQMGIPRKMPEIRKDRL